MAIFDEERIVTRVPTGTYGYDIAAEQSAQEIDRARRQAQARPVHGAGGISGAALRQRGEMEGAFFNAAVQAMAQRKAQESARLQRDAAIRDQRRRMVEAQKQRNLERTLKGVVGIGADLQAQGSRLANAQMTPESLGDWEQRQEMIARGLIKELPGGLYGYTAKGGAQKLFSPSSQRAGFNVTGDMYRNRDPWAE